MSKEEKSEEIKESKKVVKPKEVTVTIGCGQEVTGIVAGGKITDKNGVTYDYTS